MKIEFEKVCFEFVLFLGEGNIIDSRYIGNFFKLSANYHYPARALRALGLLLADRTPTGGRGEDLESIAISVFVIIG